MRPCQTMNNFPNSCLINFKHRSYFSLRNSLRRKFDDFWNVNFSKFGNGMFRSIYEFPIVYDISDIVFLCAYIQMAWINAFRIIAFVKNIFILWYFTVKKCPGISMCQNRMFVVYAKMSIAIRNHCSFPNPTVFSFLKFSQKSFNYFFSHQHHLIMTYKSAYA